VDFEAGDEGCELLYQIICLQNTPPVTPDEQALCMKSRNGCWRLEGAVAASGQGGRRRSRGASAVQDEA
jgi:hypothetical protein